MSHKNEMWSVVQASNIASLLDEAGAYEEANLLDLYIEAATKNDIVKQAGLWERVKGWTKSKLFSEYREMHKKAVEAQQEVEAAI